MRPTPARILSWSWLLLAAVGFVALFLLPTELFARAGGGGGGGGGGGRGGGLLKLIFLVLYFVYSSLLWLLIRRRESQTGELLLRLAAAESSWGRSLIQDRIREIYFKVQEAWTHRDQTLARDYVSPRLFEHHASLLEEMRSNGQRNILESITLDRLQIVEVADFNDDRLDRIWVVVHGAMIDYIVDERSGEVVRGSKSKRESFKELWKFVRGPEGWVLDEIDQTVDMDEILAFKSFVEKPPRAGQGAV